MAPSAVMASTVSSNSDLKCQSSFFSLAIADLPGNPSDTFGPASMDDLLKNLYSDANRSQHEPSFQATDGCSGIDAASAPASLPSMSQQGSPSLPKNVGSKSADEVWKEIVAGNEQRRSAAVGESMEEMTLEDFLAKAGAVREEEVRVPVVSGQGNYNGDCMFHPQSVVEGVSLAAGFVNEVDGRGMGGGRGKRRALEAAVDKVTQQKQRRMIKNRESAARSRERKQAYTFELESLVSQLEEENARLIREEAEQCKERFKQLMKSLVPVTEERRPRRCIRRVNSVQW